MSAPTLTRPAAPSPALAALRSWIESHGFAVESRPDHVVIRIPYIDRAGNDRLDAIPVRNLSQARAVIGY